MDNQAETIKMAVEEPECISMLNDEQSAFFFKKVAISREVPLTATWIYAFPRPKLSRWLPGRVSGSPLVMR